MPKYWDAIGYMIASQGTKAGSSQSCTGLAAKKRKYIPTPVPLSLYCQIPPDSTGRHTIEQVDPVIGLVQEQSPAVARHLLGGETGFYPV